MKLHSKFPQIGQKCHKNCVFSCWRRRRVCSGWTWWEREWTSPRVQSSHQIRTSTRTRSEYPKCSLRNCTIHSQWPTGISLSWNRPLSTGPTCILGTISRQSTACARNVFWVQWLGVSYCINLVISELPWWFRRTASKCDWVGTTKRNEKPWPNSCWPQTQMLTTHTAQRRWAVLQCGAFDLHRKKIKFTWLLLQKNIFTGLPTFAKWGRLTAKQATDSAQGQYSGAQSEFSLNPRKLFPQRTVLTHVRSVGFADQTFPCQ